MSCKHVPRIKVELFLDIPANLFKRLSKKNLRSKSVQIDGARWPECYLYCARCGSPLTYEQAL